MPHDRNNQELKAGDRVNIACVVKEVHTGTDYCNITLETVEPMYPGNHKTTLVLNTKQVEKVEG